MAWEKRGNQTYFYRSKWIDGRCVKEYVGTGPKAELTARLDTLERTQRLEQQKAWEAQREHLETGRVALADFCGLVELITRASLLVAGYRQHQRGQWRRRRNAQFDGTEAAANAALA